MIHSESPNSDALVHYGVKGMKWGVRKARTGQLADFARVHEKVAAGKGTLVEKHFALSTNSKTGMVRRGLKAQSAISAKNARDEIERLSTGKAKVKDILRAYGSANVHDIIRSRRNDNNFEDKVQRRVEKTGKSVQKAEKSQKRRDTAVALAVAGGIAVGKMLLSDGGKVLNQGVAAKAHVNRRRANAAASRGLPRQGSTINYSKQSRGGAYNISSL
jgi:hypothetical protein